MENEMKTLLAVILLMFSVPAFASNGNPAHDISVKVNGLVCDFCAQSIKALFTKEAAVSGVAVDLNNGLITIDLKDRQQLDDARITQLVTDSGYSVVEIKHADAP
jgi:copper chaperone CopZ